VSAAGARHPALAGRALVRRRAVLVAAATALVGCGLGGRGAWILAKAALAQVLLERAWIATRAGEAQARPWPWADTWPVARLSAPRLGRGWVVLAGASGRTMAFGPGHLDGTAPPGGGGNTVLTGHRDTHFTALRELRLGDELVVETAAGRAVRYRVESLTIVDQSDGRALQPTLEPTLTLITCYPFDALVPGGRLRYVVRAGAAAGADILAARDDRALSAAGGAVAAPAPASALDPGRAGRRPAGVGRLRGVDLARRGGARP
jgi:sortase A